MIRRPVLAAAEWLDADALGEEPTVFGAIASATAKALNSAGLVPAEIDGLLIAPTMAGAPLTIVASVANALGMKLRFGSTVDLGGATMNAMIWRAIAAIEAGHASSVVCVAAEVIDRGRSYLEGVRWSGDPAAEWERPFGSTGPNTAYALLAQRHRYEFGTTDEQRALVTVRLRANAVTRAPAQLLTVADVLESPLICDPLHLLEIVRPVSGAVAFVVTDLARCRNDIALELLGHGERIGTNGSPLLNLAETPISGAARDAFRSAALRPSEIDVVELYDCYTITVLLSLEQAGFCAIGQGGKFLENTDTSSHGDLPLNTDGGQLNLGQAGVAGGGTHVVEAFQQLTGAAGQRKVPNAETAFVHGNGGLLSEQCSLILRSVRR